MLPRTVAAIVACILLALTGGITVAHGDTTTLGYQVAFNGSNGRPGLAGFETRVPLEVGINAGTSPSIAALQGGGYQGAFQASNVNYELWGLGLDPAAFGLGMKGGTSPAVAAVDGRYVIAFQANSNKLWTRDTLSHDSGLLMKGSPSIAGLAGGGYAIAYQRPDGKLGITGPEARTLGLMRDGTNPSITALAGGGYMAAYQASNGHLTVVGATTQDLGHVMKDGTSPSITQLASGSYLVAFQRSDGSLWVAGAETRSLGVTMNAATSPAVVGLAAGGYEVAYQALDGTLSVAGAEARTYGLQMRPGTSPAITTAPVPPPPVSPDRDGDGVINDGDCQPDNAAVHPGAVDRPANKVDEDCSGKDARYPRLDSTIGFDGQFGSDHTTFTKLYISRARAGSTVRVNCKGRGCQFKSKTVKIKKYARRYDLKQLRGARLRPEAQVEIRVTKAGSIGVMRRLTMRAGRSPKKTSYCLPPGAKKPASCSS